MLSVASANSSSWNVHGFQLISFELKKQIKSLTNEKIFMYLFIKVVKKYRININFVKISCIRCQKLTTMDAKQLPASQEVFCCIEFA